MERAAAVSLPAAFGVTILLAVRSFSVYSPPRFARIAPAALGATLLYVFYSFRIAFADGASLGTLSTLAWYLLILSVAFVCIPTLQSAHGHSLIVYRGLVLFAYAFCLLNLALILAAPDQVVFRDRFFGTTSHPNTYGFIAAICASTILVRLVSVPVRRMIATLGDLSVFAVSFGTMLWSGSRTSVLSFAFILLVFFTVMGGWRNWSPRRQTWQHMLLSLCVIVAIVAAMNLRFPFLMDAAIDRFADAGNTRGETWSMMWSAFASNPFFGVGPDLSGTANSYLRVLASLGIVGGIGLIVLIYHALKAAAGCRSTSLRPARNHQRVLLGSLTIGILFGSIFEGFLMERYALPVVLFLLSLGTIALPRGTSSTDRILMSPAF